VNLWFIVNRSRRWFKLLSNGDFRFVNISSIDFDDSSSVTLMFNTHGFGDLIVVGLG